MNIRRKIKRFERRHNVDLKRDLFFALLGMVTAIIVCNMLLNRPTAQAPSKPIIKSIAVEAKEYGPIYEPTPTPVAVVLPKKLLTGNGTWTGKVSHYSRAGCIGCSATLTMANGQTLDDNVPTIAFNHLPMNTKVKITNLDNGKSIVATVTDTGGFEKYNRIADLVPAVAIPLETKTDVSTVLIEVL